MRILIVLGCTVCNDGVLTSRLDKAIEVYNKNRPELIIVTGKNESGPMMKYLISKGIPENDIIQEDKATSTFENCLYVGNLLVKMKIIRTIETIDLVTSEFHSARSAWLFNTHMNNVAICSHQAKTPIEHLSGRIKNEKRSMYLTIKNMYESKGNS